MSKPVSMMSIQKDLETLRGQHEDLQKAFEEQIHLLERLKGSNERKDARIAELEGLLHEMEIETADVMEEKDMDDQMRLETSAQRIRQLEIENERLRDELGVFRHAQEENVMYQARNHGLEKRLLEMESLHEKELSLVRSDMEYFKGQLRKDFEHQLRASKDVAFDKAKKTLDLSSQIAIQHNIKMQVALERQGHSMEELMKRFERLEEAYRRIHAESSVDRAQHDEQAKELMALRKKLMKKEEEEKELKKRFELHHVERSSLELLYGELESVKEELNRSLERNSELRSELQKWKHRVVELSEIKELGKMNPRAADQPYLREIMRSMGGERASQQIREEEIDAKVIRKKRRQAERHKLVESLVRGHHASKISLTSIWNTTMIDHPSIPVVDVGDEDRISSGSHGRMPSFASSDLSDGMFVDDGYGDETGVHSSRSWMASSGSGSGTGTGIGEQRGRERTSGKSSGSVSSRRGGHHPRLPPVSSGTVVDAERDTLDAKMSVLSQKDRKRRRRQETIAKSAQLAKDASMLSVSGSSSASAHTQRYVVP